MPEWVPVPGYEGRYAVSDDGPVLSLPRVDALGRPQGGRLLIARRNPKGYLTVGLYLAGVRRTHYVHQIVAAAFLGPRPDGHEARHLDGDQLNCGASNLAWGTSRENKLDCIRHGTHREAAKTHCPQGHPYSGSNLIITAGGTRQCLICKRASTRAATRRYRLRELNEGK